VAEKKEYTKIFKTSKNFFSHLFWHTQWRRKKGTLQILKNQKICFQIFWYHQWRRKQGTLKILKNQKIYFQISFDMTSGEEKRVH